MEEGDEREGREGMITNSNHYARHNKEVHSGSHKGCRYDNRVKLGGVAKHELATRSNSRLIRHCGASHALKD